MDLSGAKVMLLHMLSGAPDDLSGVNVMVFIAFSGVHVESFGCQCTRSRGFGCSHRLGFILLLRMGEGWLKKRGGPYSNSIVGTDVLHTV